MKYKLLLILAVAIFISGLSSITNRETNTLKTGQVIYVRQIDDDHYLLTVQQRQCKESEQLLIGAARIEEIKMHNWIQYRSYRRGCPKK